MNTEKRTAKVAVLDLQARVSNQLLEMELQERYLSRKFAKGEKSVGIGLGQLQGKIKEQKDFLSFLDEVEKEHAGI